MRYLMKIWWEDAKEAEIKLMTADELINWFNMSDCYPDAFSYDIYAINPEEREAPVKIWYVGWQPGCIIAFDSETCKDYLLGFGTDH